ncbi:hypothetical protein DAT35_42835 [Vitiosangium sp. GDMCC 1.1324]|nr:hypothetical protein DAT35_42835 [Vitiosangium sp. GDMCC 1.1324]
MASAALQAGESVNLSLKLSETGSVQVTNLSKMGVEQVEIVFEEITYSHACNAVLGAGSSGGYRWPWQKIAFLGPQDQARFQLPGPYGNTDGGLAAIKRRLTSSDYGCGAHGRDERAVTLDGLFRLIEKNTAKGNFIPACSEENPCSEVIYVEARAMHPKLFKWAGPFDQLAVKSADGTIRESDVFGSLTGEKNEDGTWKDTWSFHREEERRMFTKVAQWLRRGSLMRGDRHDGPERAFGGVGVYRAIGEEDPALNP